MLRPVRLIVIGDKPKISFEPLIGALRLSVRARVICCGGVTLDAGYSAYFPHELGCEPWISIADDFRGEAEVCEHVFDVKCGHSFCVDLFLAWDEQGCFGAIVVGDGEYRVISLRHWQLNDEVQCDGFKGECFWSGVDGL